MTDIATLPLAPPTGNLVEWWEQNPQLVRKCYRLHQELILDNGAKWGDVMEDWQPRLLAAILGLPDAPSGDLALIECCGVVGCGKDQFIAAAVIILLYYGPRGVQGYKQSVDRDKSKAVVQSVRGFMRRSSEADPKSDRVRTIGQAIRVIRDKVQAICMGCEKPDCTGCKKDVEGSRGGQVVCESLDGPSTAGVIYDIAFLNEVQTWPAPHGEEVYAHIFARRGKRNGRLIVMSNAPKSARGDWRRDRWDEARREGSDWFYLPVTLPMCPWITVEEVDRQRRNLTRVRFARWFELTPSDGGGDLLDPEEIRAAIDPSLVEAAAPSAPGQRFLGIDIGIKKDHAVLCLLRLERTRAVFLERVDVWVPSQQVAGETPLAEVEERIIKYGLDWKAMCLFDPHQAEGMRQNAERAGVKCEVINATAVNLTEQAHAIMDLFRSGRMRLYPQAGFTRIDEETTTDLMRQLDAAEVKEQERGIRLIHKRTKAGHGDQASAFALAALGVSRIAVFAAAVGYGGPAPGTAGKRQGPATFREKIMARMSGKLRLPGGKRRTA